MFDPDLKHEHAWLALPRVIPNLKLTDSVSNQNNLNQKFGYFEQCQERASISPSLDPNFSGVCIQIMLTTTGSQPSIIDH